MTIGVLRNKQINSLVYKIEYIFIFFFSVVNSFYSFHAIKLILAVLAGFQQSITGME